jgi:hypothetical protein
MITTEDRNEIYYKPTSENSRKNLIPKYYSNSMPAYRNGYEDWIKERLTQGTWVFATFTFKHITKNHLAHKAVETLGYRLSKSIYKNAFRRRRKKIEGIAVPEGDNISNRIHYHAILKVPDKLTPEQFEQLLRKHWVRGIMYYEKINSEIEDQNKVVGYVLKRTSKEFSVDETLKEWMINF